MADAQSHNKENVAPQTSSDPLQGKSLATKGRTGRSKSIGPGDLSSGGPKQDAKQDAKNRRKSTHVPVTKSIIGATDEEKAKRQAERRKTLANRRVSFAPEATLHTWDVIEFMRDHTTSTDSDQTRRSSLRSSGSPAKRSGVDDGDPPSTPPDQEDEPDALPHEPEHQRDVHKKQRRRSSGIPPMNFNNPEDFGSSSGMSGSSDGEDSEEESEEDDDATGTAMSLDMGEETAQSLESASSTSSSGRLDAALKQAAIAAGTRGIHYDEHGDGDIDESETMDIAGEEITNAFKPWAQQRGTIEPLGSASLDQENVNPFSPAFKAQMASGTVHRPSTVHEEDTGDMSMDVTKAVGGIMRAQQEAQAVQDREDESLLSTGDGTMELTQAVGKIHGQRRGSPLKAGQKRRRQSTTEAGSPGATAPVTQPKRRRSSMGRTSMGDDTMDMDLTMVVGGGIQKSASPAKSTRPERRRGSRRRSSSIMSEQSDVTATMDFTQAVGDIKKAATSSEDTATSFDDENEELTMELTTVLGGIRAGEQPPAQQPEQPAEQRPVTPQNPSSPAKANTTPKDQERFLDVADEGPKKLLTPIFQKTINRSAEKAGSGQKSVSASKRRKTLSPAAVSWTGAVFDETRSPDAQAQAHAEAQKLHEQQEYEQSAAPVAVSEAGSPRRSPLKEVVSYPELPSAQKSPVLRPFSPSHNNLARTPPSKLTNGSPRSALQQQLEIQLEPQKVMRSSPLKQVSTPPAASPERPSSSQDVRKLTDSIKLMNTPRKETLKNVTPKKNPAPASSPVKSMTSRGRRPAPKARVNPASSPARQLSDDLLQVQASGKPVERMQLQAFLEQANIRFMDITATKRRMTAMPTPSKARKDNGIDETAEVDLGSAVVAAACAQPEHDMFQHACHELKHYISEGKKVIKQLEAETYQETPPLIAAYTNAPTLRKAELDTQMRDMKTHTRFRSKEMWYAWRSQLLEDLMKALSGIGEGMIKDDDLLSHAESVLEQTLSPLQERFEEAQSEAQRLQAAAAETDDDEKEELEQARERLVEVDAEIEEKRRVLAELQAQSREQEAVIDDLQENKAEFTAAIQEAERVREACRGVSVKEITELKESIRNLEQTHNWSLTSLSNSSGTPTITMTYKCQLQLFFHPSAFFQQQSPTQPRPNSPISLTYIARDPRTQQLKEPTTALRFFLQLLRASLHALPQCTTTAHDLLRLVSGGWETALQVAESERRLNLECMAESRIVSDERLTIECHVLLRKVRTKVRVAFELEAKVGGEGALELQTQSQVDVKVVYGERYDEAKMKTNLGRLVAGGGLEGWAEGVRELRPGLAAQRVKGVRR
ncbi:Spc7-domain-containing protein [Teratosphaeria nubilosa]|uniref:Spc7-domain-containing protein n=1 Tax=Teratosphaeria nubilosa TaxID=161662 RepID=A0A6G1LFS7_9PEZI|nr:Spc7-domain-containing protein [Teratosphaeria nubilosa]